MGLQPVDPNDPTSLIEPTERLVLAVPLVPLVLFVLMMIGPNGLVETERLGEPTATQDLSRVRTLQDLSRVRTRYVVGKRQREHAHDLGRVQPIRRLAGQLMELVGAANPRMNVFDPKLRRKTQLHLGLLISRPLGSQV